MRVAFVTAELAPLARVGGLAEAASGLVRALRAGGVDVDVIMPDYFSTPLANEVGFDVEVPDWIGKSWARRGHLDGFGDITLVHVPGIERPHPYVEPFTGQGWHDNDYRFFAFCAAAASVVARTQADVVHVNDWHTAALLAIVPDHVATVISIHNLAYQGMADGHWMERLGWLGVTRTGHNRMWAYECFGSFNPLAGGIILADRVVAVSPNYAEEITQPEQGYGLDGVLRDRGDALVGILNGIDADEWNPVTDPFIASRFARPGPRKAACRAALMAETGLDQSGTGPLIGVVTRLVEQKGVDVMLDALQYLPSLDARLVVLGAGDPAISLALHERHAANPTRIAFREGYDLGFAHRIFAGSDLFLMPSRFEPCGLAQMQAMAYATIPVTTSVGGLVDTVIDADDDPEKGNGFRSRHVSGAGLTDALHRATRAWLSNSRRRKILANGMERDWSWRGPAERYRALYESVLAAKR